MVKIVIISPYTKSLINFRGEMIKDLVKLGHEVITLGPDEGFESQIEDLGANYINYPLKRTGLNPLQEVKSLFFIIKILRRIKPYIVLSYAIKPVIYGSLAASLVKIPKIYSMITGLGYAFTGTSFKQCILSLLVKSLFRFALRNNRAILFQNPDDLKFFQQTNLLSKDIKPVLINGSGVDIVKYYFSEPKLKPISFLLIARLIWNKGIKEYIDAAKILKNRYPDVIFKILGPFDSNPTAVQPVHIDKWAKEGIVEYLGRTDNVKPYIADCSVYVLPSYYREGTPRSILEAMSMGKPIITTNAPGCRETVVEGINGFLIPVKNSGALAQVMERFILKPNLIVEMGVKSREIALKKYDVRKVNKVILKAMDII